MIYDVTIDGKNYRVDLDRQDGQWSCRLDGRELELDAALVRSNILSLRLNDAAHEITLESANSNLRVWVGSTPFIVEVRDPRSLRGRKRSAEDQGRRKITAAMPGKVVRLLVREGDAVEAGAGLMVVEAMKMQNEVKSPKKGAVHKIFFAENATVNAGDVLAIVE
jgi:biotin carboxyl carrier protein